jgi:hypothetical protein
MTNQEIDDLFDILFPSTTEAKERVEKELRQERKDSQSLKDWLNANRCVKPHEVAKRVEYVEDDVLCHISFFM